MWKNFRDIGAMAQKLGDVVAPPADHDDEDDDDGDELSEDDDIYNSEDDDRFYIHGGKDPSHRQNAARQNGEEEEEEDDDDEGQKRGPFGFVGLIKRAIDKNLESDDSEDEDYEEDEHYDDEDEEEVEIEEETVEFNNDSSPSKASAQLDPNPEVIPEEQKPASREPVMFAHSASHSRSNSSRLKKMREQMQREEEEKQSTSNQDNSKILPEESEASKNTFPDVDTGSGKAQEPASAGLVREKGSMSPRSPSDGDGGRKIAGIPPELSFNDDDPDIEELGDDDDDDDDDLDNDLSVSREYSSSSSDKEDEDEEGDKNKNEKLPDEEAEKGEELDKVDSSPRRRTRVRKLAPTYSTDSLLQGDVGRSLRKERQKGEEDVKEKDHEPRNRSPSEEAEKDEELDNVDMSPRRTRVRRGVAPTHSTDSLLQGDVGRTLRKERQKAKEERKQPSPRRRPVRGANRPEHRIVEARKSGFLLDMLEKPKPPDTDDEQDELDIPLHKNRVGRRRPVPLPEPAKMNPSPYSDDEMEDELDAPNHRGGRQRAIASGLLPPSSNNDFADQQGDASQDDKKPPAKEMPGSSTNSLTNQINSKTENGVAMDATAPSSNGQNDKNRNQSTHSAPPFAPSSSEDAGRIQDLERECQMLRQKLAEAEHNVIEVQQKASKLAQKDDEEHERMMDLFREKEARLLEAAAEDHQNELRILEEEMTTRIQALQRELEEERNAFQHERDQIGFLLNEANSRAEEAEREANQIRNQSESTSAQIQQQQVRALRMSEDKLARALALLDEKEENERNLNATIEALQSKLSEHHEGVREVEEELDEIHNENEELQHHVESLKAENEKYQKKIAQLQADSEKLSHLKMEMRLLKEDHEREKSKRQTVTASAESTTAQLVADRDTALAEVQDLKQQLAQVNGDLEIARADVERVSTAHNNLQSALEAFQNEREAELAIWEENKRADEEAARAAHAVALEATLQTHKAEIRKIQAAADAAVQNGMEEIKLLEEKLETFRLENVQMRRSLDEAISRLQTTQDDVIDRTFMKNILLDWLTKKGVKERRDVLEMMASMLHFTEEEKQRVDIGHSSGLSRLVGQLPETKADLEHLEGENVREKWVNFLLAETDDD